MPHILLAFCLMFAALSAPPPLAAQSGQGAMTRSLTVVADEWPPFSGADLPRGGLSLDVIATVLERAGYDVDTRVVPWARIMDGARAGRYDVIGSLFADDDLARVLDYGDAFYTTQVQFVQRAGGAFEYTDLAGLRPYSIAVGDGFLYEEKFDRADDLNKVGVTTTAQAVQMVAHGRVDLTLDSVDVLRAVLGDLDPALADRVDIVPGALAAQGLHMGVRNDLPDSATIVADFNATLAQMRADGTLDVVLDRHVQRDAGG